MATLIRRAKNILTSSTHKPLNTNQGILSELTSIEADLQERIEATQREVDIWGGHAKKWEGRSHAAEQKKKQADTIEGEEAMEILQNQAERYSEFYKTKRGNVEKTLADLQESYSKINEVIRGLNTVEKTKTLDERLRQMAIEENIEIKEEDKTFDMRAIAQATHTARALLELQTTR